MNERGTVLLVDDEPTIQRTLSRALARLGFEVSSASNGDEALRLLAETPHDVIVTDLTMEGTDGLELLEHAKRSDPDCSIVVMTGFSDADSTTIALRLGADDYVAKPFDYEEILLRICGCADRCRLRRKVRLYEQVLPVCPVCKKVRDGANGLSGQGEWLPLGDVSRPSSGGPGPSR